MTKKQPWMREIEIELGLRDLWLGAWHKRNGLWVRVEVLADIWPLSTQTCFCCLEPKIITPDDLFLACQYTGQLKRIKPQTRKYVLSGWAIFPCPQCYGQVWERRTIENRLTTSIKHCRLCGRSTRTVRPLDVADYLEPGWTAKRWQQPSEFEQIKIDLEQIKKLLKEQKR